MDRVNLNQGAESTLAFLLALQEMRLLEHALGAFQRPVITGCPSRMPLPNPSRKKRPHRSGAEKTPHTAAVDGRLASMIPRLFNCCLLHPEDMPPSQDDVRVAGVFNPGAAATNAGVVLLVRVAECVRETRPGFVGLPRWDVGTGRIVIDWMREEALTFVDARVVKIKSTGLLRLTFTSHLRVVRSRDGRSVDSLEPGFFLPADPTETFGVEDPRITPLDGRFYLTYVAVSEHGAATALASTHDFRTFERHGIILAPENKDVVLFPEKIGEAIRRAAPARHGARVLPAGNVAGHVARSHPLGRAPAVPRRLGRMGCGPRRRAVPHRSAPRAAGWKSTTATTGAKAMPGIGAYSAGALLLDLENPGRVIGRHAKILVPQTGYERMGFVPDVVFPTGIVDCGDTVLVYYGAADSSTAVVEWRLSDLL